jgi:hypothetical protein
MYLAAISFIREVKTGAPFSEHSPLLHDISQMGSWAKVEEGLAKMYRAEVLGKLPVVQHLLFGSLFPASWQPSRPPVPPEAQAVAAAADSIPVDEPEQAVAPWLTGPPAVGAPPRPTGLMDPVLTGVAPWARTGGEQTPAAALAGGRPTAPSPSPSTMDSFVDAFGPPPPFHPPTMDGPNGCAPAGASASTEHAA